MGFGFDNVKHVTAVITDPGADDKKIPLFRADQRCELKRISVTARDAQGAGSAGQFSVFNMGTSGTAVAGTVGSAGGTAVADRLSAGVPKTVTLTAGQTDVGAGEWLVLDYQETGDWVEGSVTVHLEYVDGIGA